MYALLLFCKYMHMSNCVISQYQAICVSDSDPVPGVLITIGFLGGGGGGGPGLSFVVVVPAIWSVLGPVN